MPAVDRGRGDVGVTDRGNSYGCSPRGSPRGRGDRRKPENPQSDPTGKPSKFVL